MVNGRLRYEKSRFNQAASNRRSGANNLFGVSND
jgi:hypothetical protein